jgi:hypothetical protein
MVVFSILGLDQFNTPRPDARLRIAPKMDRQLRRTRKLQPANKQALFRPATTGLGTI